MKFIVTALVLHVIARTNSANVTEDASANKSKRTVAGQIHSYGEGRPVMLYSDNSALAPQGLASIYAPVTLKPVFDPELHAKQVAAQQVLYEFQQTPTNAVSNVHVNQFYQPLQSKPEGDLPPSTGPAQFISGSESVATPVQHSSLIRHGQNFAQVQYNPLQGTPQHIQTHQYIPGKYLYVNGKILYQPNQQQQQQQPQQQQQQPQQQQHGLQQNHYHHQNGFQQRPGGFLYTHPQAHTHKFMPQVPIVRPMRFRQFQPPQPHQFQPITKPMNTPEVTEEQNEEEAEEETPPKENEEVEEEEEEESDDNDSYEENDDGDRYFGKYAFDNEEDRERYRGEEDDDNERESSKPVPKKQKKSGKPNKYSKSSDFKFSENYSSSSKYEKPAKKGKKSVKKGPKMHYKAMKYTKENNGKPRIEKIEKIEAKQSQNIPVIHKHKMFKEKWYVAKSTDDSRN